MISIAMPLTPMPMQLSIKKKKIIPIPVILMHPIINKKQSYANTFNAEPNNFNCHGSNFNSDKSK